MKKFFLAAAMVIFVFGCANVKVGGAKEPIKMDITMRLDIYQHVEKDIDAIEGIVAGTKKAGDQQSCLSFFVGTAYAQEALGPEVEQAALRRKARLDELHAQEGQGVIGENAAGLVEARADSANKQLIESENTDRMVIYNAVAAKNGTSVAEVQKLYAKRLQGDAPAGTPIEVAGQWQMK